MPTQLELPFETDPFSAFSDFPVGVRGLLFVAARYMSVNSIIGVLECTVVPTGQNLAESVKRMVHLYGTQGAINEIVDILDDSYGVGYPITQFKFEGSTNVNMGVGKTKPGTPSFDKHNYGKMTLDEPST